MKRIFSDERAAPTIEIKRLLVNGGLKESPYVLDKERTKETYGDDSYAFVLCREDGSEITLYDKIYIGAVRDMVEAKTGIRVCFDENKDKYHLMFW